MSFDKNYPNRKDQRSRYYGGASCDRSCRPNGGCNYCKGNRTHKNIKRELAAKDKGK